MGDISKEQKLNRLHQRLLQKNGHYAEVIRYTDSEHITLLWDNKAVSTSAYKRFRDGRVSYKTSDISRCIGDKKKQKNGHIAEIIKGPMSGNISVRFEDGTIVGNTTFWQWEQGNISYPAKYEETRKHHVGRQEMQKNGYVYVIDYVEHTNKVHGHFLDGKNTKTITSIKAFNMGVIPHPDGDEEQIRQKKERLGSGLIQSNGLTLTIDRYRTSQDCGGYFEDGTRVEKFKYYKASTGHVGHPTLSSFGHGTYMGFKTFPAFTEDKTVYYTCRCNKCGLEDILTPRQMAEHRKSFHEEE